jgi:DNA (cytosine-5)-methyltransferase 1
MKSTLKVLASEYTYEKPAKLFPKPLLKVKAVKFIDLFAGLGGTRIGFEQACKEINLNSECVFTSEIKDYAIDAYKRNFNHAEIHGDITKINPNDIPNFDYLLAGFPCQPFSSAGKRNGFLDERGGLFFTIHKILAMKKPQGFLLENVDGLVNHEQGKTIKLIISELEELGYHVTWKILDASEFGVPQKRKRVYIIGHKKYVPNLNDFKLQHETILSHLELNKPFEHTPFTKLLSDKFSENDLVGKSIKDKRGGSNNIHSWDLGVKGPINSEQKKILELILKKRRNKSWAALKDIDWMDGMPLTIEEIKTFYDHPKLQENLNDLTQKGYLKFEHPKKRVTINGVTKRVPHTIVPKGYNIVAGKLSFPIAKILDPNDFSPTIVATEVGKLAVFTPKGVRPISVREGLRFSGFPDSYKLNEADYIKSFDLIGNTVMPPVIKAVSLRLLGNI